MAAQNCRTQITFIHALILQDLALHEVSGPKCKQGDDIEPGPVNQNAYGNVDRQSNGRTAFGHDNLIDKEVHLACGCGDPIDGEGNNHSDTIDTEATNCRPADNGGSQSLSIIPSVCSDMEFVMTASTIPLSPVSSTVLTADDKESNILTDFTESTSITTEHARSCKEASTHSRIIVSIWKLKRNKLAKSIFKNPTRKTFAM